MKRGDEDLDGLLGLLVAIVLVIEVEVQRDGEFRVWLCTSRLHPGV